METIINEVLAGNYNIYIAYTLLVLSLGLNIYALSKIVRVKSDNSYLRFNLTLATDSARCIHLASKEVINELKDEIAEIRKLRNKSYNNHYKRIAYYEERFLALNIITKEKHSTKMNEMVKDYTVKELRELGNTNIKK